MKRHKANCEIKLLRALEKGGFKCVGGEKTIKVDVGLIAATNRDLEKEVIQKTLLMTYGSKKEAAKILGISRRKIEYKLKDGISGEIFSSLLAITAIFPQIFRLIHISINYL